MKLADYIKEKGFYKVSLEKNYLTGEKTIVYYYPTMDDYNWHKERLAKSKWNVVDSKLRYVRFEDEELRVLKVTYSKQELSDWDKKQRGKKQDIV